MRPIHVTLALALASCTGAIGDGASTSPAGVEPGAPARGSGPAPSGMVGAPPSGASAAPSGVGTTPLRRLTRVEYDNTIRDLLGDRSRPGDAFPDDALGASGFHVGGVVSPLEARSIMSAARTIAANAAARIPQLVACDPARMGEDACTQAFIQRFGKRVYRRPLAADEVADLTALHAWARRDQGYAWADAIRVVLQAMLQSPSFLYHHELATAAPGQSDVARLTPHAVAARLSYFLWSSTPDDTLLAEADANRLATPEQIEAQARRLLADPRAGDTVRAFHADWLQQGLIPLVEKDPKRFPDFTPDLRAAMALEAPAFVTDLFASGGAKLEALLTADWSFVDARLAKVYGIPAPKGTGVQKASLDPAQGRAGILTQLGFLAAAAAPYSTSPIKRGVFVREQVLCQELPPPPAGLNPTAPTPDPTVSAREQFRQHSDDPACRQCHQLIDPLGFAFESFDGIGRYRATDGGKPVDATGQLIGTPRSDGKFDGARDLAVRLARSEDVRQCLARQWFRFAVGRREGADQGSIDQAYAAFARSGFDLRELLVGLSRTQAFSFRAVAPGEVLP